MINFEKNIFMMTLKCQKKLEEILTSGKLRSGALGNIQCEFDTAPLVRIPKNYK